MRLNIFNCNLLFVICLLFSANAVFANLRAPWVVNRYPSYALSNPNTQLVVLKENLEFNCNKPYAGDGNLTKIMGQSCKVEVVYFIQSTADASYTLEFILPSDKLISTSVNDLHAEDSKPNLLNISDLEKEGYRLSDLCAFCETAINKLYTASFKAKFISGLNTIRIKYEQPLSVTEISHGYFQSSKWSNAFAYELWPLREWKLDSKFEMNIKFTTQVGSTWSRFFNTKITAECRGLELRFVKSPGSPFKKQMGSNGFDDYYKYNQNLNPNYTFTNGKTYYDKDNLVYELSLKENFPDRLSCYFGHERN